MLEIIIEEVAINPVIQVEEVISTVTVQITEMQTPGPIGPQGTDGADGVDGADGKSAYQSALDGGFVGTELEFNTFLSEVDKLDNLSGINTGDETASTIINKIGDGSKINQSYLPSYVDDILEYDTVSLFPLVGELGKIYIVTTGIDINKQYRWTGSLYAQITNGLIASTNDVPEGVNNLYFTTARVLSTLLTGISFVTGGVISATDSILVALGKLQKQIIDNNSNAVKNIIKDVVPTVPITGTINETIFKSYLIPANTFLENDMMKIPYFEMAKIGGTTGATIRIYLNTSNALVGANLVARYGVLTNLYVKISRQFNINAGVLTGVSVVASQSFLSDLVGSTSSVFSIAFNPTIDNYIITTGQLSLASESIQQRGFCVTN